MTTQLLFCILYIFSVYGSGWYVLVLVPRLLGRPAWLRTFFTPFVIVVYLNILFYHVSVKKKFIIVGKMFFVLIYYPQLFLKNTFSAQTHFCPITVSFYLFISFFTCLWDFETRRDQINDVPMGFGKRIRSERREIS